MATVQRASEATQPERRLFFVLIGAVNLAFLALDVTIPAPHKSVVLAARALLTVWLFGAPLVLGRQLAPRTARWFTRAIGVLLALTFGALTWASGGMAGLYGLFYPMLPMIVAIVVPDDPWPSGLCGLTVCLVGWTTLDMDPLFWGMGTLSITLYAAAGAWFHRRSLRRQEVEREQALLLEQRLVEAHQQRNLDDRLSLLGRLVANVAHELRNPLAAVSLNVSVLRTEQDRPTADAALADVEEGLTVIRGLIDDLRAFSRDDPGTVGACELEPLLGEALRFAQVRLKGVATVEQDFAPGPPRVKANARRLVQVLVNLLVNAAEAVEGAPPPRRVRLRVTIEANAVAVSVEDNGPGIAPELRETLFTPFTSTKGAKGTGLGLSLSRDNLAAFDASIEAGSSDLGGARLTVRLRRAD